MSSNKEFRQGQREERLWLADMEALRDELLDTYKRFFKPSGALIALPAQFKDRYYAQYTQQVQRKIIELVADMEYVSDELK